MEKVGVGGVEPVAKQSGGKGCKLCGRRKKEKRAELSTDTRTEPGPSRRVLLWCDHFM